MAEGKVDLKLTDIHAEGVDLPAAAQRMLNTIKNRLTATIRTPKMPYTLTIQQRRHDRRAASGHGHGRRTSSSSADSEG